MSGGGVCPVIETSTQLIANISLYNFVAALVCFVIQHDSVHCDLYYCKTGEQRTLFDQVCDLWRVEI